MILVASDSHKTFKLENHIIQSSAIRELCKRAERLLRQCMRIFKKGSREKGKQGIFIPVTKK